ncbi:hypothetical protein C0Q70_14734 [Pomacea canaliculata]|uniref:Uncharacterized protein n=1 Tax=Pomacea canaliculata TaxID=400727 RepID=A0A2T7NSY8_POMCA|nr:hypothetical protein C0Q70_14734 [Pomacea canaliculata]
MHRGKRVPSSPHLSPRILLHPSASSGGRDCQAPQAPTAAINTWPLKQQSIKEAKLLFYVSQTFVDHTSSSTAYDLFSPYERPRQRQANFHSALGASTLARASRKRYSLKSEAREGVAVHSEHSVFVPEHLHVLSSTRIAVGRPGARKKKKNSAWSTVRGDTEGQLSVSSKSSATVAEARGAGGVRETTFFVLFAHGAYVAPEHDGKAQRNAA